MIDPTKELSKLKKGVKIYDTEIELELTIIGLTPSNKFIELESCDPENDIERTHFYRLDDLEGCKLI